MDTLIYSLFKFFFVLLLSIFFGLKNFFLFFADEWIAFNYYTLFFELFKADG